MKKQWMKIGSLLLIIVLATTILAACATNTEAPKPAGEEGVAMPSNPGGPGEAVNLTGDAAKGAEIFANTCVACHGQEGKVGIPNAGADEDVPVLNPIDPTLKSSDYKTFATNLDLFLQNGSTPKGDSPSFVMAAYGKEGTLTQQQIADVIAYIISLNK